MRRVVFLAVVVLVGVGEARAHSPATAIGRAVEAFDEVSVSYEPGSVVSDVEAGGFPQIVGADVKVAFMPESTDNEILGGPEAVASEIAREAELDGTLVVLVGTRLGVWSDEVEADRLDELVRGADTPTGGSPAAAVETLVRRIQAEPKKGSTPWGWITVALSVGAGFLLLGADRLASASRRKSGRSSPARTEPAEDARSANVGEHWRD